MTNSPEYLAWAHIKSRCYNPKTKDYKWYGGKGIRVCQLWYYSFEDFYIDMGPKTFPNYSIDRIDTLGNYCPKNCRWADLKTQRRNKTSAKLITFNGETRNLADWAEITGIHVNTISTRIDDMGWSPEKAFSEPVNQHNQKLLTYKNITKNIKEWAVETNLSATCITKRLKRGWTIEKTLETPLQENHRNYENHVYVRHAWCA